MEEISKITVNGTTYTLKDETARAKTGSGIPDSMALSGWTSASIYQNRVTNYTGGYYKNGRCVYVYIVCKAAIAFNVAAAFTGFPTPASKNWSNALTPLTALTADGLNVPCFVNQYGSLCMTVPKDKYVIVNGYYFAES